MLDFSYTILSSTWKEIYQSKPRKKRAKSKGVDNISIEQFENEKVERLRSLSRQLKDGSFVFNKLFHYQVLSPGKDPRDIQVPTVQDRIVQKVMNEQLVKQYFITEFWNAGIVGSKGSNVRKAMARVMQYYRAGFVYVLKTDISKYFPTIDPDRLRHIVAQRIKDEQARRMIYEYLSVSELSGIPQGPPLSPLMANLYLLGFDKQLARRKKIRHIRYVDDVLVFSKTKEEAVRTFDFIQHYFEEIGLKVHPLEPNSKTVIDRFDSGSIDALGVVYRNNKLVVKKKKYVAFLDNHVHPIRDLRLNKMAGQDVDEKLSKMIDRLNHVFHGWAGAYGFCDIGQTYKDIDHKVAEQLTRFLKTNNISSRIDVLQRVYKLSKTKLYPI